MEKMQLMRFSMHLLIYQILKFCQTFSKFLQNVFKISTEFLKIGQIFFLYRKVINYFSIFQMGVTRTRFLNQPRFRKIAWSIYVILFN